MADAKKWFKTVKSVRGPLLIVEKVPGVSYGEICEIRHDGEELLGQVLETSSEHVVVQLFESSMGLTKKAQVRFKGEPARIAVSTEMVGKMFNGLGKPIDGSELKADKFLDVNGSAINPASRKSPHDFIQTGVSVVDCMTTLVRGQKLPIFSSAGQPHNELAAQIVRQAHIEGEDFLVIFAAMGITNEEARFFRTEFEKSGSLDNTIVFMNLADDSSIERILTPRVALTTAEYFAYEHDKHVLVVLTDFTNYCDALRELSSARSEVPGRRGYPGYLYTDLASNYERAGSIQGSKGTITQIPILTMPAGDKTHPIPDLTGYITEGQIVLDPKLQKRGFNPPLNPLPSLSRLMKSGIGDGKTREDHSGVSDQLYASYAYALELRQLVAVIGESSLTEVDRQYLTFADRFEKEFVNQGFDTNRTIEETLNLGWEILKELPRSELKKVKQKHIDVYQK